MVFKLRTTILWFTKHYSQTSRYETAPNAGVIRKNMTYLHCRSTVSMTPRCCRGVTKASSRLRRSPYFRRHHSRAVFSLILNIQSYHYSFLWHGQGQYSWMYAINPKFSFNVQGKKSKRYISISYHNPKDVLYRCYRHPLLPRVLLGALQELQLPLHMI